MIRPILIVTMVAQTAFAADSLTFNDVARLLGDKNPRIAAEREAIASARADRISAGAYPNPKIGFNHQIPSAQSTMFNGIYQETVGVEQPILIPGQRSARIAKANADIAAAQAHVIANTGNIAADACVSFTHLLALQQKLNVLSNSLAAVTTLRQKISGRAEQGAASAYDVARIEVEQGVVRSRYENARADFSAEAANLAALLNLTNGIPTIQGTLAPWNYSFTDDPNEAPSVIAANRDVAAVEAAIKSAQRERWPDVSLEAARAWTRHPYGAVDQIGINVEIPIFDTKRGPVEKARSEARAAEARRIAALAEATVTISQLTQSVQTRQSALDRYRTEVEPKLSRLTEMTADAYTLGKHTLLELLDAEQTRREVYLEQAETTSALVEAQIHLLAATGRLNSYLQSTH